MALLTPPKRGDVVLLHSMSTGLNGQFLVDSYDPATQLVSVVPGTMNLQAIDPDWPKDVALADIDVLISASGVDV